jgi:hypothetical protein
LQGKVFVMPENDKPRISLALLTRLVKSKLRSPECRNKVNKSPLTFSHISPSDH